MTAMISFYTSKSTLSYDINIRFLRFSLIKIQPKEYLANFPVTALRKEGILKSELVVYGISISKL